MRTINRFLIGSASDSRERYRRTRRVFPDATVDRLSYEISMTGVSSVFLDHIYQQPSYRHVLSQVDLVRRTRTAATECLSYRRSRSVHGRMPQTVERFW